MMKKYLSLSLVAASLWISPAGAQSVPGDGVRLQIFGRFFGANHMVAALSKSCVGDYGDGPYDAQGVLTKLKPYLRAGELSLLTTYINTPEFLKTRRYTYDRVRRALRNITAVTHDNTQSCNQLTREILQSYDAIKASIQGLP